MRVVDQELRVDAELFIQKPFVAMGDAVKIVNAVFFQSEGYSSPDIPNIRYRTVMPQRPFKRRNIQISDMVGNVLRRYIQSDFRQKKVRSDSRRRADSGSLHNGIHQHYRHFFRRFMINVQIIGRVYEHFVNRIRVNVVRGDEIQISAINVRGHFHIPLHTGQGRNVSDVFRNFKNAATVMYSQIFHRRSDRQTDSAASACRIGNDKVRLKRIKTAFHAFHGRIKRFQVDAQISLVRHIFLRIRRYQIRRSETRTKEEQLYFKP